MIVHEETAEEREQRVQDIEGVRFAVQQAETMEELEKALRESGIDTSDPAIQFEMRKDMEHRRMMREAAEKGKPINESTLLQTVADYNKGTKEVLAPIEIKHSFYNHKRIWEDTFTDRKHNIIKRKGFDIGMIPPVTDKAALIIGSGQSLDKAGPLLKDWKGGVFCSTSQASTLRYYGRPPDFIVALDPRTGIHELASVDKSWFYTNTVLIANPCISPVLLQYWPNRVFYHRIMEPQTYFYTDIMTTAYDFLGAQLFLFSCSISALLGIARLLGYSPLFLVGCDFGSPNNKARFTQYHWPITAYDGFVKIGDKYQWMTIQPKQATDDFHITKTRRRFVRIAGHMPPFNRMIPAANGVPSDAISIYYKRSVICVARLDMSDIINTSTEGIITEFPEAEIEEVVANQGKGFENRLWDDDKKIRTWEGYLAAQNTFVINFEDGSIRFVETKDDPMTSLPQFCEVLREMLKREGKNPDEKLITANAMKHIEKAIKEAKCEESKN